MTSTFLTIEIDRPINIANIMQLEQKFYQELAKQIPDAQVVISNLHYKKGEYFK